MAQGQRILHRLLLANPATPDALWSVLLGEGEEGSNMEEPIVQVSLSRR